MENTIIENNLIKANDKLDIVLREQRLNILEDQNMNIEYTDVLNF